MSDQINNNTPEAATGIAGEYENYQQGDIIEVDGRLYIVHEHNPKGVPGISPEFVLIAGEGGSAVSSNYEESKAPDYLPGQIIMHGGAPYIVNEANPTGAPLPALAWGCQS